MDQMKMMTKAERRSMGVEEKKKVPKVERMEQKRKSLRREVKQEAVEITLDGVKPVSMRVDNSGRSTCLELNFTKKEILGKGDFGEVSVVECKITGARFAMKIVKIRASQFKYQEVHSLQVLPPHQNVVKFYRAWEEASLLYIQTELCEQSLAKYSEVRGGLTELEAWTFMVDMVQAVNHLHSEQMIHADIKPENVLVTKDGVAKLADFGLATDLENPKYAHRAEEGDSRYLAPEVLNTRPTKAADIYSLGVTVLEVATDLHITGDVLDDLRSWCIPERILGKMDESLRELVRTMMARDPKHRPTSKELMEHPKINKRVELRNKEIEKIEKKDQQEEAKRRDSLSIKSDDICEKESSDCSKCAQPKDRPKPRGIRMDCMDEKAKDPVTPRYEPELTFPKQYPNTAPGRMEDTDEEGAGTSKAFRKLAISAPRPPQGSSPPGSPTKCPGPSSSLMSPVLVRKRQSTTQHTPVVDRQKLCVKNVDNNGNVCPETPVRTPQRGSNIGLRGRDMGKGGSVMKPRGPRFDERYSTPFCSTAKVDRCSDDVLLRKILFQCQLNIPKSSSNGNEHSPSSCSTHSISVPNYLATDYPSLSPC